MKLGEMLVRDGRLTEDQVEQAVSQQGRTGGRMGTVLFELGFVDLDTLTIYLGIELGIPIATGKTLDRAKRSAVRCLSPEDALRFRCVPIVVQDRNLIAAIDDPHDFEALEDLSRITGYRVVPRVAPEIRIFYYLERYYGIPRPPRFAVFGDQPRGTGPAKAGGSLPGLPLPGLPPVNAPRTPAPSPAPALRTKSEAQPPVPIEDLDDYEELEIEAADLLIELEEDDDEVAAEGAGRAPATEDGASKVAAPAPAPTYDPVGLEDTLAAMESAQQRTEISSAIMSYMANVFETGALCIVRDNMAFGWKGFGPRLERDRIETLLIPLSVPSILEMAVAGDGVFSGPTFPGTMHKYLFKVLRSAPPPFASAAVIRIGKRIVNVMYGHQAEGAALTDEQVEGLRQVAEAAGAAYLRLIAASKGGSPRKRASESRKVLIINKEDGANSDESAEKTPEAD